MDPVATTPHKRSQEERPELTPLLNIVWSKRVRKSVEQLVDRVVAAAVASPVKLTPMAAAFVVEEQGVKQIEFAF